MKFIVRIDGHDVLLNAVQVEALTNILQDCEMLIDKSVGKNEGTHGYNMSYVHIVKQFVCWEGLTMKAMPQEHIDALKLITKLNTEE